MSRKVAALVNWQITPLEDEGAVFFALALRLEIRFYRIVILLSEAPHVAVGREVQVLFVAIFDLLEDSFAAWGCVFSVLAEFHDVEKRTKRATQFDRGVVVIPF